MSTLGRLVISSKNHFKASHKSRMLFKTHVSECTILHLDKRTHMFAPEPLIIYKMVRLTFKYFKPKTERKESRKRPRCLEKSRQTKHERTENQVPKAHWQELTRTQGSNQWQTDIHWVTESEVTPQQRYLWKSVLRQYPQTYKTQNLLYADYKSSPKNTEGTSLGLYG